MTSTINYPELRGSIIDRMADLTAQIPDTMAAFSGLHRSGTGSAALDTKTKELMALAIAVAQRCDGCIAFHTHDALKAGATEQEIAETLGVAIVMGGGPSMVYATNAMTALQEFSDSTS